MKQNMKPLLLFRQTSNNQLRTTSNNLEQLRTTSDNLEQPGTTSTNLEQPRTISQNEITNTYKMTRS